MIATVPFGRTGHDSTRTIFGAAALARMSQERADAVLQVVLDNGLNHIDTAASYGDSELRLAPFLRQHRDRFFLASKTGDRTYEGARASIRRSLERTQGNKRQAAKLLNLKRTTLIEKLKRLDPSAPPKA